ncbi:MAG: KpsF/GutQ family sugar-phosphate isomerase [Planctomycetales bacterium]
MSMEAPRPVATGPPDAIGTLTPFQQIQYAREIIQLEAGALQRLAGRLNVDFSEAVRSIHTCPTSVIVTGMGKAGLIGKKIAATFASTGTRSHFLHPAEAYHGDLGCIHRDDVLLVLSQSGETEEVTRLLPSLASLEVSVLAITQDRHSTLGQSAAVVLELGPLQEACSLGLAPSTTTTTMLPYGDALALVVSRMREFSEADFARFHPGGSLGRRLSKVEEKMRPLAQCRQAPETETLRNVLIQSSLPGRRSGAIMVVDREHRLSGIFTDSDLARLLEDRADNALNHPIGEVMTPKPIIVPAGSAVADAVAIMAERKLSELPVVDEVGKPIGLLDITDLWRPASNLLDERSENLSPSLHPPHDSLPPPKLTIERGPNSSSNT